MKPTRPLPLGFAACLALAFGVSPARADDWRNRWENDYNRLAEQREDDDYVENRAEALEDYWYRQRTLQRALDRRTHAWFGVTSPYYPERISRSYFRNDAIPGYFVPAYGPGYQAYGPKCRYGDCYPPAFDCHDGSCGTLTFGGLRLFCD